MHSYHANCGCFTCGQEEALTERRNESLAAAIQALIALPSFVGEALGENPMSWEAEVTAALASGDDAEAGRVLRYTVQQYAQQCLCDMTEDRKCSPADAASSLIAKHTPAVIGAAA